MCAAAGDENGGKAGRQSRAGVTGGCAGTVQDASDGTVDEESLSLDVLLDASLLFGSS
jgi:hypothetical protein